MKRWKMLTGLLRDFMKFGLFTFGGGWSIVAQMQKRYVEQQGLLTQEELLDLTSVGRSLPGTMIGNVAMLFGYRMAGFLGGLACVVGMATPPMAVLTVITLFYSAVRHNPWVMAAMMGVRCAVVPIIASALVGMVKGAFRWPPCAVVTAVSFCLYLFLNVNCVWLVIIGAVCGLILSKYMEGKGEETP